MILFFITLVLFGLITAFLMQNVAGSRKRLIFMQFLFKILTSITSIIVLILFLYFFVYPRFVPQFNSDMAGLGELALFFGVLILDIVFIVFYLILRHTTR